MKQCSKEEAISIAAMLEKRWKNVEADNCLVAHVAAILELLKGVALLEDSVENDGDRDDVFDATFELTYAALESVRFLYDRFDGSAEIIEAIQKHHGDGAVVAHRGH